MESKIENRDHWCIIGSSFGANPLVCLVLNLMCIPSFVEFLQMLLCELVIFCFPLIIFISIELKKLLSVHWHVM